MCDLGNTPLASSSGVVRTSEPRQTAWAFLANQHRRSARTSSAKRLPTESSRPVSRARSIYDSEDFCINVKDEDGELVGQLNLDNLYQEYCRQPSAKRDAFLTKMVKFGLVRHKTLPEDFADAKPDILPAVRSRYTYEIMWLEQRAEGKPVGPDLPFSCVGDHLMAMPVYDLPEATHTISRDQLELWGVSFYETMEVAKHNLAEIEFPVAKSNDHLYGVMAGDSYDSSRLLLLDFVRQLGGPWRAHRHGAAPRLAVDYRLGGHGRPGCHGFACQQGIR